MKRYDAFEFCELASMPTWLQRITPEYLEGALTTLQFYRPVVPLLANVLQNAPRIVDLCAGAGGPIFQMQTWLQPLAIDLTLTDKFPQPLVVNGHEHARYDARAIDAMHVPPELHGTRTLFNCFHHFAPAVARTILQNAVTANEPIAIFESTERSVATIAKTLALTPISVLVFTLLTRPSRLLLYPLAVFIIAWDAIVSCLRTYTPSELRAFTAGLDTYDWQIGQLRSWGLHITYLIGEPKKRSHDFAGRV